MATPTFVTEDGHHALKYTSRKGTENVILVDHISDYSPVLDKLLTIKTASDHHELKFDTVDDRDAAVELLRDSLASHNASATISEKMAEGELYNVNIHDGEVAPEDTLDVYFVIPARKELSLFVSLEHGGEVHSVFYSVPTITDDGELHEAISRSYKDGAPYDALFYKDPAVSSPGTQEGEVHHFGNSSSTDLSSRTSIPTFVLTEGRYLLRAINKSGYWMSIQRKIQFWESDI